MTASLTNTLVCRGSLIEMIAKNPLTANMRRAAHDLKYFERISDHATNSASGCSIQSPVFTRKQCDLVRKDDGYTVLRSIAQIDRIEPKASKTGPPHEPCSMSVRSSSFSTLCSPVSTGRALKFASTKFRGFACHYGYGEASTTQSEP